MHKSACLAIFSYPLKSDSIISKCDKFHNFVYHLHRTHRQLILFMVVIFLLGSFIKETIYGCMQRLTLILVLVCDSLECQYYKVLCLGRLLELNWLPVTNSQAYQIAVIKSFMIQVSCSASFLKISFQFHLFKFQF